MQGQVKYSFTPDEWNFISNALCVAAETYEKSRGMVSAEQPRLAEQFERQTTEALRLASEIEQSV